MSPAIREALATMMPSEERTRTEEDPSQEPPRAAAPPASFEPRVGPSGIPVTEGKPSPTLTVDVLAAGPRNTTNSHTAVPQTEMEVRGTEKGNRALPPVPTPVEKLNQFEKFSAERFGRLSDEA